MRPTITILDEPTILAIVADAKRILSEIGIEIRGNHLRQRLLNEGLLTAKDGRLLFPVEVIDRALATAPQSFVLYDRDGEPHAAIGGNHVHFVPGSSGLEILDHRSGLVRPATTKDFIEYVRLADGLPHIAYLATAFSTGDVPEMIADAWRLYLCLTNSRKPMVSGSFTEDGVPRMANMMALFRRDRADMIARPLAIFTITPTGNFRFSEDSCQNLIDCVEWGIPVEITPVTLMGLVAPVTLVGATVFHTADVLAGITMAQLLRPGAPVIFGGAPAVFHMKTATSPMSAIEAQQLNVAYAAVAKFLGLPVQAYMALSDSKQIDAQAGAETFTSALLAALAGINSVSGPGMLDYVKVFSLAKLVLDDDLCGQALHFVRYVEPASDLPAFDLARQLLEEQQLITAEHTLEHWPQHLYLPGRVIDRLNRQKWEQTGSSTLLERATADVHRFVAEYQPVATDERIVDELRRLLQVGFEQPVHLPSTSRG